MARLVQNIGKATSKSKHLKTNPEMGIRYFLVMFHQQDMKIYWEQRRDDSLLLTNINDDTCVWSKLKYTFVFGVCTEVHVI